MRVTYAGSSFIWLRNSIALYPVWAIGSLLFGFSVLLPRSLAQWALIVPLDLVAAAFFLSYRVPAPFLPGWLREEIRAGITPVARPDRFDWLLFWIVMPAIILGSISLPLLNTA